MSEKLFNCYLRFEEANGKSTLTFTKGDYSKVAEGERCYKEAFNSGEGLNPILVEIKRLVEGYTL